MGELSTKQIDALEKRLAAAYYEGYAEAQSHRRGKMVLDHLTCRWETDWENDTAICRTHGEVVDGVDSPHFPGADNE